MEIKEIPTLEQKQAFWAEQLPSFESTYWLPSHFEFLAFDMDQGNYVIKDDLDPIFEDDATEIWHRVNTGWAMWKKAIKFTEQQATHEGFVLVPKELSDEKATSLAYKEFSRISSLFYMENRHEPDSSKERLKRIWIANKIRNLKVFHKTFIEAQEQSHELD